MSLSIPQVVAILDRGICEKTSRICSEHELPILELVHGVVEVDEEATQGLNGLKKTINSIAEEYGDLARVYGECEKTGLPLVERAHGSLSAFSAILSQFEAKKPRTTKE